ncbi:MAG: hypothetical protein IJY93_07275 [Clostridia bacterium]|nr:hypothetical protein [Clostridia bacterium]
MNNRLPKILLVIFFALSNLLLSISPLHAENDSDYYNRWLNSRGDEWIRHEDYGLEFCLTGIDWHTTHEDTDYWQFHRTTDEKISAIIKIECRNVYTPEMFDFTIKRKECDNTAFSYEYITDMYETSESSVSMVNINSVDFFKVDISQLLKPSINDLILAEKYIHVYDGIFYIFTFVAYDGYTQQDYNDFISTIESANYSGMQIESLIENETSVLLKHVPVKNLIFAIPILIPYLLKIILFLIPFLYMFKLFILEPSCSKIANSYWYTNKLFLKSAHRIASTHYSWKHYKENKYGYIDNPGFYKACSYVTALLLYEYFIKCEYGNARSEYFHKKILKKQKQMLRDFYISYKIECSYKTFDNLSLFMSFLNFEKLRKELFDHLDKYCDKSENTTTNNEKTQEAYISFITQAELYNDTEKSFFDKLDEIVFAINYEFEIINYKRLRIEERPLSFLT